MAEGGQMPFPGRDLEEENKALRAEIERLRKVLASNGLTSVDAGIAIDNRYEMCNRCASLTRI